MLGEYCLTETCRKKKKKKPQQQKKRRNGKQSRRIVSSLKHSLSSKKTNQF